jgi:hypothetical protein
MKTTMAMTLDGLVRALRWKALDLAERMERSTLSVRRASVEGRSAAPATNRRGREDSDDRSRG